MRIVECEMPQVESGLPYRRLVRITPPPGTSPARARFHRKRAKMPGPIIEEQEFQRQWVRMELGSNMIIAVDLLRGINVGFWSCTLGICTAVRCKELLSSPVYVSIYCFFAIPLLWEIKFIAQSTRYYNLKGSMRTIWAIALVVFIGLTWIWLRYFGLGRAL